MQYLRNTVFMENRFKRHYHIQRKNSMICSNGVGGKNLSEIPMNQNEGSFSKKLASFFNIKQTYM
jgi:hypothetical protein